MNLGDLLKEFIKNQVRFDMLKDFTETDLKDMKIEFGPRRTIIKKLKQIEDMTTFLEEVEIGKPLGAGGFGL